jgi:hypothetical protein
VWTRDPPGTDGMQQGSMSHTAMQTVERRDYFCGPICGSIGSVSFLCVIYISIDGYRYARPVSYVSI